MGENSLPCYGSVASGNRLVRTRLPDGVGRAAERPALTRLANALLLLIVSPNPDDLYGLDVLYNLIDKALLDVDLV